MEDFYNLERARADDSVSIFLSFLHSLSHKYHGLDLQKTIESVATWSFIVQFFDTIIKHVII